MASKQETRRAATQRASETVCCVRADKSEVTLPHVDLQAFWLSRRLQVSRELASAIAELAFANERRSA
jgi:hypothetical protein